MKAMISLFNIPIDRLESADVQALIFQALTHHVLVTIATVNPEMLLAASHDVHVRKALCSMTYRIPDGVGVSLLLRLLRYGAVPRHPGSDLFVDICRSARQMGKRVVILGGWGTTTECAIEVLKTAFPGLDIHGLSDVTIRVEDDLWDQPSDLLDTLSHLQPDVLAVALGGVDHRQERWIADHASAISGVKLAIGIGGTVDMIAGVSRRAPALIQSVGMEWLWRLFLEPWRMRRIARAVVIFPMRALLDRMKQHES